MVKVSKIIVFKMTNHKIEPLHFIDTPEELMEYSTSNVQTPKLFRQITFLKEVSRPLWQEDNQSYAFASPIKTKTELPKITFDIECQNVHQMEFVANVNYRGKLKQSINLKNLNVPNSKYYTRPQQLVIKDEKGTVILFASGRFRVMGCVDVLEASLLAIKYAALIDNDDVPDIYSQSYTSHTNLGYNVNLNKLCQYDHIIYEPELFTAARITKYNPVSVNVFSSGSIVACGLKELEHFYDIISDIDAICKYINL